MTVCTFCGLLCVFVTCACRVMSLLNLCMQWVSWERVPASSQELQELLRAVKSVKHVREAARKDPRAATAWAQSMEPVLRDLAERLGRGMLKKQRFCVATAATPADIDALHAVLKGVSADYDPAVTTLLARSKVMPGILRHLQQRGNVQHKYLFQVR